MSGSPPRVREKPRPALEDTDEAGITPASAGKTSFNFRHNLNSRGSPPRVREKLIQ